MARYLAIALAVCAALVQWSSADTSGESQYHYHGGVPHLLPPPRHLYRKGNTATRSGRAPGDNRPNFVIFFPDGKEYQTDKIIAKVFVACDIKKSCRFIGITARN